MTQVVSNVIVKNFESDRPRKLLVASVLLAVQPITSASKRPQPRKTDILKVFQEGDEAPIIARLSLPRTHFSEILGLSYSKKKTREFGCSFLQLVASMRIHRPGPEIVAPDRGHLGVSAE